MNDRVKEEADAYNEGTIFANSYKMHSKFWHVFDCPNSKLLEKYFEKFIAENTTNAVVLDYGCFDGTLYENTLAHYQPAKIFGIDISDNAILRAKEKFGNRVEFQVMDAHKTTFADNTFDLIVGRAILHHLEYDIAIKEIRRILKPGGHAIFMEPMGDNPVAKVIRKFYRKCYTKDEKALSREKILWADSLFHTSHHMFANLVSVPIAMISSLLCKTPNSLVLRIANHVDIILAKTPLRFWMRQVTLIWEKDPA